MKKITLLYSLFLSGWFMAASSQSIPHLEITGNVTRLIVKDVPFLILGGELHNSSTSGAEIMRPVWRQMARKNLNTVIAPVYWELIEPAEGRFDFSLVDSMIAGARSENLHLVLLWFGSWKNGYSMYVPGWVKNDQRRFPRAKNDKGESFQMLSAFGKNSANADAAAFRMLMRHIRETDSIENTVITVQVENEMGLFATDRDYCDEANKAFRSNVPSDLSKYLHANKSRLHPSIDSVWKANGYRSSGSWEDIFGKSITDRKNWKLLSSLTEELFTVYHYAKYIEKIASAGKEEYPLPLYVNAWIKQSGGGYPGKYPCGGPVPHTLDIWRAAAPSVDFIAPDIYVAKDESLYTMDQYHRYGNPLFIPEYRHGKEAALIAFSAYANHDAISFAPFAIDDWDPEDDPITESYAVIGQLNELILRNYGKGTMAGIYVDSINKSQDITLGGYKIKAQLAGVPYAQAMGANISFKNAFAAAGIIISTGPDEFIVAGKDFTLTFNPLPENKENPFIDVEYMDEGGFQNGLWVTGRRLNGDEGTGGGDYGFGSGQSMRYGRLQFQRQSDNSYSILRFKMYHYK